LKLNCHAKDALFSDTHIEITLSKNPTESDEIFIAEVTPRIRKIMGNDGEDWSTETLKEKLKGKKVLIEGWLFFDYSHRTENYSDDPEDKIGRENWRETSWEIHPITNRLLEDTFEVIYFSH